MVGREVEIYVSQLYTTYSVTSLVFFWIFESLFVEAPHEIYHLTQLYIVRGGVVYFKKLQRADRAQGKSS